MSKYIKPKVKEVSQNLHKLEFNDGKVLYLVGTAHVSASSAKLVEDVIKEYKPDSVCVELDELRYKSMMQKKKFSDINIIDIIRKKQLFFFIGQFILSSFQKKMSEKTGCKPGMEFKKAITLAKKTKAKIALVDRNIGVTLKRAWRLTRFRDKLKLFASLLSRSDDSLDEIDIEKLKGNDAIETMVKSFAKELPLTKKVLIDERDKYLTSEIVNNLGTVTVAVVGAGHVPGMLKQIKKRISDKAKEQINFVPPPSKIGKMLPWLIPVVFTGMVLFGFIFGDKDIAKDVLVFWVLANGILTAIGCILSFAHPLTIIAGFIAAPITSLNPMIGAGFVTAIVQTLLVKPRVKDIEQIQLRTVKFKQWWSNRVTKIFLVFILSSIGSSIGTFVALPVLTKLFGS